MKNQKSNHKKGGNILKYFLWLFLGAIILCFIYYAIVWVLIPCLEQRGQFGNSFGAIATIFSGIAK